jgi:hypothetical protein
MKGSVVLSLSLDVAAIGIMLIPPEKFARLSTNPKLVTNLKRGCFLGLLLSGWLIDHYISHPG